MKITNRELKLIISKLLFEGAASLPGDSIRKKEKSENINILKILKKFKEVYIDGKEKPHASLRHIQFDKKRNPISMLKLAQLEFEENKIFDKGSYVEIILSSKLINNIVLQISKDYIDTAMRFNKGDPAPGSWDNTPESRLSFYLLQFLAQIAYYLNRAWYYLMGNAVDLNIKNLDKLLALQIKNRDVDVITKYPNLMHQKNEPIRKFFKKSMTKLRKNKLYVVVDVQTPLDTIGTLSGEELSSYYHPVSNVIKLDDGFFNPSGVVKHEFNHMTKGYFEEFNDISRILRKSKIEFQSIPKLRFGGGRSIADLLGRIVIGTSAAGKNDAENLIKWYAKEVVKDNKGISKKELSSGLRISQMRKIKLPDIDYKSIESFIFDYYKKGKEADDKLDKLLAVQFKGGELTKDSGNMSPFREYIEKFYCLQDDHILEVGMVLSRMMMHIYDYEEKSNKKRDVRKKDTYNIFLTNTPGAELKRKKYVGNFIKDILSGALDTTQHMDYFDRDSGHQHDLKFFNVLKDTPKTINYFVDLILNHV
jgi:hypothetical protein